MRQSGKSGVPVNDLDSLSDQHVPDKRDIADNQRQDRLIIKYFYRQVIYFQAVCHIADADSFPVTVRYDDHFVTFKDEALREVVNVFFDSSHVGVEEV